MSDSYFIKDYERIKKIPKNTSNNHSTKTKRFDSASTISSCGENTKNNSKEQQLDNRFEARQIPEDVKVKKSFLSSQQSNNNTNTKSVTSIAYSSMSQTNKHASYLSSTSMIYSVILSIRECDDGFGDYNYKCFQEVEMVLDDDVTVESVTREIIEKLNNKMAKDLIQRNKNYKNQFKTQQLLHPVNHSEDCFEISQCSKNGEPKGCSFDRNQFLRNIGCKSRICLKVLDSRAYDPIILKLLDKQPAPQKKYDFNVSPIPEQEDDLNSLARATLHYKDSLIQKEIDVCVPINNFNNSSFMQQSTHINNHSSIRKEEIITNNQKCQPPKKTSFWKSIFSCRILCS